METVVTPMARVATPIERVATLMERVAASMDKYDPPGITFRENDQEG